MIFNGIEILFFLLGAIAATGVFALIHYAKKYKLSWYIHALGGLSLFLLLFTIAWAWSSILEKEPQAAGLGLLTFGIPTLICLFLTRRMLLKSELKIVANNLS